MAVKLRSTLVHSMNWSNYPLLRLLPVFAAGLLVSQHWNIISTPFIPMVILTGLVLFLLSWFLANRFRFSQLSAALSLFSFFILGMSWTAFKQDKYQAHYIGDLLSGEGLIQAFVCDVPKEKASGQKLIISAQQLYSKGTWMHCQGKAQLFLPFGSTSKPLEYGQELLVRARIATSNNGDFPGEFNNQEYLASQGIYCSLQLKNDRVVVLNEFSGSVLRRFALNQRKRLLENTFQKQLPENAYGVAAALIFGDSDHLDPETIRDFAASGALHILSVSGLHVAIVFMIFSRLFGFLDRISKGIMIKNFLLLLVIWSYALLTGLSPSVLRCSVMVSFVLISTGMGKQTNVYNSLAGSAIVLLIIDPFLINDIGFQLSYLAVAGIVYLQPLFSELWQPRSWLMKQAWLLVNTSVSAQLATLPLSFFYFHRFPTYFLIANLLVIPLSSLALYLGLGYAVISTVPGLNKLVLWSFKFLLIALDTCISTISHWPYSSSWECYPTGVEVLLLYLGFATFIFFLQKRSYSAVLYLFILLTFLMGQREYYQLTEHTRSNCLLWRQKNGFQLMLIEGNNASVFNWLTPASNKKEQKLPEQVVRTLHCDVQRDQWIPCGKIVSIWTGNSPILLMDRRKPGWKWRADTQVILHYGMKIKKDRSRSYYKNQVDIWLPMVRNQGRSVDTLKNKLMVDLEGSGE